MQGVKIIYPQILKSAIIDFWKKNKQHVVLSVYGDSMAPLIRKGDRVSIFFCNINDIKIGDIIAFTNNPNQLVIHRAIAIHSNNDGYQICQKGDNSPAWSWISHLQVFGKVQSIIKHNRVIDCNHKILKIIQRWISILSIINITLCDKYNTPLLTTKIKKNNFITVCLAGFNRLTQLIIYWIIRITIIAGSN